MRRTTFPSAALIALVTMALGGCSAFDNLGGGKKVSPDEFKIVSHSPLTMPPNAELRPPRPGEPRPQEVTPADQANKLQPPGTATFDHHAPTGTTPVTQTGSPQANRDFACNWVLRTRSSTRVPKPCRLGGVTIGPPISIH